MTIFYYKSQDPSESFMFKCINHIFCWFDKVYDLQLHGPFSYLTMGSNEKYSLYALAVALRGSGLDNVVFESQQEQEIYLLLQNVLSGWWVHSACYSVSTGSSFSEVKWLECEAYNSPSSSSKVKTSEAISSPPLYASCVSWGSFVLLCLIYSICFYKHFERFITYHLPIMSLDSLLVNHPLLNIAILNCDILTQLQKVYKLY